MQVNKNLLKFFSVIFAVGLWFYVLNSEPVVEEHTIGIEYILPKGMSFNKAPLKEMKVTFKGPKAFIRTMSQRDDKIRIDLNFEKKLKGQNYRIELNESYLPLPLGVEVEKFEVRKLKVVLGESTTKTIPIHLNLVGQINENRRIVYTRVRPTNIEVRGSKKVLSSLSRIQTRPVDLGKIDGQGQEELNFLDLDQTIDIVIKDPVIFEYRVVPKEVNSTINEVPIRFLSSSTVRSASHRKVSLLVFLDDENMKITHKDVQVIADIPNGAKGKVKIELSAKLKEGVHLMKINPSEIWVNLK